MNPLPLIPALWLAPFKAVPAWVYVGGAASAALLAALAIASHHGAERQAKVDAPIVAQVPVAQGQATLNASTTEAASARHQTENVIAAHAVVHEAAIRSEAAIQGNAGGGWDALDDWLCDTPGDQPGCPAKGR